MYTSPAWIVLFLCTGIFTVYAAVIDYQTQRIPNKLTLPMFAAGWIYQLAFWHWGAGGPLDALGGFAIGFGMFFILWIIGGGGGGDAKLVGAVSVWLGFRMTLGLIVISTVLVILGTGLLMLYGMMTKGVYRTKREFLPSEKDTKKKKSPLELLQFNRGRKGMTYGLSVAIATVLVVCLTPAIEAARANRLAEDAAKASNASDQQQQATDLPNQDPANEDGKSKPDSKEADTKTPEAKK